MTEDARETKPYRDEHGFPMTHGELRRRELKALGHGFVSHTDEEHDRELRCEGTMQHHGDVVTRSDGARSVDWDGDVWHHELTCSACGYLTTISTEYKRHHVRGELPGQREREQQKEAAEW